MDFFWVIETMPLRVGQGHTGFPYIFLSLLVIETMLFQTIPKF